MGRILKLLVLFSSLMSTGIWACDMPASVCFKKNSGFPLIENGHPLPVVVDIDADPAVKRVAESFC